jgi:hypothetical protein
MGKGNLKGKEKISFKIEYSKPQFMVYIRWLQRNGRGWEAELNIKRKSKILPNWDVKKNYKLIKNLNITILTNKHKKSDISNALQGGYSFSHVGVIPSSRWQSLSKIWLCNNSIIKAVYEKTLWTLY